MAGTIIPIVPQNAAIATLRDDIASINAAQQANGAPGTTQPRTVANDFGETDWSRIYGKDKQGTALPAQQTGGGY